MYKLQTVREYARTNKISDTAVHKRVKSKLVHSCQLDGILHIAVEDTQPQIIKNLRQKIKLLNSNIETLKIKAQSVIKQDDEIMYLRERVKSLESDYKTLVVDLRESTKTKEDLYEKVINTLMITKKE